MLCSSLIESRENFNDDWNERFLLLNRNQMAVSSAKIAGKEADNFLSFYGVSTG